MDRARTTPGGRTAAQKIIARAAGLDHLDVGDVAYPKPEFIFIHDGFVETAWRELSDLGFARVNDPERLVFVTDHEVAYGSQKAIQRGANIRRIARDWKVGHFFDVGRGGHGHIFPIETGMVRGGMFVFAYDMHATNFGAAGALTLPVSTEITAVLATGSVWVRVPQTVRVTLEGNWRIGAHGRDLGFMLAAGLAGKGARWGVPGDSRVIEFDGSSVTDMPLATRVALCNSVTEIGVATVLFPPLPTDPAFDDPSVRSDADATFEATIELRLDDIEPQVALPGSPQNAAPVSAVAGTRIDHAFIGACGSGMYEDFAWAAQMMRGRRIADGVRMFVVPGTVDTARRLATDGILQIFLNAGAVLLPPGCGPCAGGLMGPLGAGETSISTAATNHAGRFGEADAQAYLGSPLTVAASALAGHIQDPRDVMRRAP